MRYLLFFLFILPLNAHSTYSIEYNKGHLLEEEVNGQEYTLDERDRIGFSYHKEKETFSLYYGFDEEKSQNGASQIKEKKEELVFWYLRSVEITHWDKWQTELGAGLGFNWSEIKSTFLSSSTTRDTDKEIVLGLLAGAKRPIFQRIWYGFDVRALYSPNYSMEPSLEISFLKLIFQWE